GEGGGWGRVVDLGRRLRAAARADRADRRRRRPRRRARLAVRVRRLPRGQARCRARPHRGARPRAPAHGRRRAARGAAHLYGDAPAQGRHRRARPRPPLLGALMKLRVAHLYPEYLNIYADRGNIAVLTRRAALRGHDLEVEAVSLGDDLRPGRFDLAYIGGGQDREQVLIAPDLAARGPAIYEAVDGGAALLAVCGGYQLLGRGYRG